MKSIKRLTVQGTEYKLVSDDVRLSLTSPGRATFRVQAGAPLAGVVVFEAGMLGKQSKAPVRFFIGLIETSTPIAKGEQQLFCRELSAALNRDLPLGLRRVTVPDVLAKIAEVTDLRFVTPDADYMSKPSAYFHHCGGGYQALDALGPVYEIPEFIWQQLGDGSIYVGSWADSPWAKKAVATIPDALFSEFLTATSGVVGLLPQLRPGVRINRGIITAVQLKAEKMVISWTKRSSVLF